MKLRRIFIREKHFPCLNVCAICALAYVFVYCIYMMEESGLIHSLKSERTINRLLYLIPGFYFGRHPTPKIAVKDLIMSCAMDIDPKISSELQNVPKCRKPKIGFISDPFDTMSDYPILHIFSFLPRADLLKLTEVNKNFNRIVTTSSKTMSKIPLCWTS